MASGYDDRAITSMVRHKQWRRIRRGYYMFFDVWLATSDVGRHLAVARAVVRSSATPLILCDITGALALGALAWQPALSTVHVSRLDDRHGRTEHGVTHHRRAFALDDCLRIDDDFVVAPPAYTIFGAMARHGLEGAVVIGDSAVNRRTVTEDDLSREATRARYAPDTRTARFAVGLVDGRAESPGESLIRMVCYRQAIPRPELQFPIRLPRQTAYLDFMWEDAAVGGEFDGKLKYQRSSNQDEDPGEVVFREKRREDEILEQGTVRIMRRFVWADIHQPDRTAARIRTALEAGTRRRTLAI